MTKSLALENLDAQRDWGHARDYVSAMWQMLQQEQPDDYVIATGRTVSVRKFCEMAFANVDLQANDYITIDPTCLRPAEVDILQGDASKAKKALGWDAETSIEELVSEMVEADLARIRKA